MIATRKTAGIALDPGNRNAVRWNPAGASIEAAAAHLGVREGLIAVIGGTEIFGLFLGRYDVFWLTLGARVDLPGGVPVFTGIPQATADDILRKHGLAPAQTRLLDTERGVVLTKWLRN